VIVIGGSIGFVCTASLYRLYLRITMIASA
jgi:hypothetical protein